MSVTVYAIVRAGGRQEKVAVGDVITVDRLTGEDGTTVQLPALLLVDGGTVTSDASALAGVTVTGEIVGQSKGPKITILRFKNKTGYRRRQGHRSKLTQVRVTDIASASAAATTRTADVEPVAVEPVAVEPVALETADTTTDTTTSDSTATA